MVQGIYNSVNYTFLAPKQYKITGSPLGGMLGPELFYLMVCCLIKPLCILDMRT